MTDLNLRNIPEQLKRDLKALAGKSGTTVKAEVIAAIEMWLKRTPNQ